MSCGVCSEGTAKYKCPGCLVQTCCLNCVRQHKAQNNCSGQRDKTAYVSLNDFNEMHLLSDYRLLEDVDRKADSVTRDPLICKYGKRPPKFVSAVKDALTLVMRVPDIYGKSKSVSYLQMPCRQSSPGHQQINNLCRSARQRGTTLKLMPDAFTKRKNNTTRFVYQGQFIVWHVEWLFPQAEIKYTERLKEDVVLADALKKFLSTEDGDALLIHSLKRYVSGVEKHGVKLFLRVPGTPANKPQFYELKKELTLKEAFQGKTIIEYPSIHVVLGNHSKKYPRLDESNPVVDCQNVPLVAESDNMQSTECTLPLVDKSGSTATEYHYGETPQNVDYTHDNFQELNPNAGKLMATGDWPRRNGDKKNKKNDKSTNEPHEPVEGIRSDNFNPDQKNDLKRATQSRPTTDACDISPKRMRVVNIAPEVAEPDSEADHEMDVSSRISPNPGITDTPCVSDICRLDKMENPDLATSNNLDTVDATYEEKQQKLPSRCDIESAPFTDLKENTDMSKKVANTPQLEVGETRELVTRGANDKDEGNTIWITRL